MKGWLYHKFPTILVQMRIDPIDSSVWKLIPAIETVWEGLAGEALLEKVCYKKQALRFQIVHKTQKLNWFLTRSFTTTGPVFVVLENILHAAGEKRYSSILLSYKLCKMHRCNNGTNVIGVTSNFVKLDLRPTPWDGTQPAVTKVIKNLRLDCSWAYGKTLYYYPAKET